MFQTVFFTVLAGIVGTAGSIVLRLFVKNLPAEAPARNSGISWGRLFLCFG